MTIHPYQEDEEEENPVNFGFSPATDARRCCTGVCPRYKEETTFGVVLNFFGLHYNPKGAIPPSPRSPPTRRGGSKGLTRE